MTVKLLTEHYLTFLSLKGCCTGSSESTLVKIQHCWKSHVTAQLFYFVAPTSPDPLTNITPALCRDLLGSKCQKVKDEGHCDNVKVSLFCLSTCDKCPTEATTAPMGA